MLTATVRGQQLQLRTPLIVADSINYITARFAFDKDWEGRAVTAFFTQGDKAISAAVTNNEITAEQGINLTAGTWEVKLTGVKGDSRITAGPVKITALPFGSTEGELPDISPTQYEALLAIIGSLDNLTTANKDSVVGAINETNAAWYPNVSEDGTISWERVLTTDAPKPQNIKGNTGTGIESITARGQDKDGGNVYRILLTDGTAFDFTAPKGATGPTGPQGKQGEEGTTPHIGDNGNWFIGDTDTGMPSRGENGVLNLLDGYAEGSVRGTLTRDPASIGRGAAVFGVGTEATQEGAFASGTHAYAKGKASHAEGELTQASGLASHAEGDTTTASGAASHAEGHSTEASGSYSHSEGYDAEASGYASHAEGEKTQASGHASHAQGSNTTASGGDSHAEGIGTTASGEGSHAEGKNTTASGYYSHAEGRGTVASRGSHHVEGEYNIVDALGSSLDGRGKYLHIAGNGEDDDHRSNAHTLDWEGNTWYQGRIKVGGTGWDDATDEVAYKSDLEGLGSISDSDILAALVETDSLPAITNLAGAILTDSSGNIILRY